MNSFSSFNHMRDSQSVVNDVTHTRLDSVPHLCYAKTTALITANIQERKYLVIHDSVRTKLLSLESTSITAEGLLKHLRMLWLSVDMQRLLGLEDEVIQSDEAELGKVIRDRTIGKTRKQILVAEACESYRKAKRDIS